MFAHQKTDSSSPASVINGHPVANHFPLARQYQTDLHMAPPGKHGGNPCKPQP
jgi:hypothetical protein